MTLLVEVMERPLDPGYAAAAARRAAGAPPAGSGARTATLVGALVAGLVLTWSVLSLRAPAPAAVQARALLVEQIEERTNGNDAAKARIEAYRAEVRAAQSSVLTRSGDPEAAASAAALGVASGELAVTGPGLELTVDDAVGSRGGGGANADPREDSAGDDGRVLDRDLQTLVNGLWAGGAEAISINGQRLTARSAIRSAGEAILVDFRPLVPPYVVSAIGDPSRLQTDFVASSAGAYMQSLQDNFGIRAGIKPQDRLTVPGSGTLGLREATPRPEPTTSATSASATGSGAHQAPSTPPPTVSGVATTPAAASEGAALPSASTTGSSDSEASK